MNPQKRSNANSKRRSNKKNKNKNKNGRENGNKNTVKNGNGKKRAEVVSKVENKSVEKPSKTLKENNEIDKTLTEKHETKKMDHEGNFNRGASTSTAITTPNKTVSSTSGCNGIFSRRLDFSSFNLLPKTRLNSYQVKMEDEGNHGNDETRLFILSSLAQNQKSRVSCILCEEAMLVFDRYPLVDGSFFLSPKQHSPGCIEVKQDNVTYYLTAVCMGCLDGHSCNRSIYCRFCGERWDGSSLVLGTMYSYDIFAAMPCCAERLKCNTCFKLLLHPQQRLNFFSDYSHCVTCPYCSTQDTHFVKPLGYCYTKQFIKSAQAMP